MEENLLLHSLSFPSGYHSVRDDPIVHSLCWYLLASYREIYIHRRALVQPLLDARGMHVLVGDSYISHIYILLTMNASIDMDIYSLFAITVT